MLAEIFLHELNVGQTSKHFIRKLTEIKERLLLLFKGRKPEVKNKAVCETIGAYCGLYEDVCSFIVHYETRC
jgi:hypothetical protein